MSATETRRALAPKPSRPRRAIRHHHRDRRLGRRRERPDPTAYAAGEVGGTAAGATERNRSRSRITPPRLGGRTLSPSSGQEAVDEDAGAATGVDAGAAPPLELPLAPAELEPSPEPLSEPPPADAAAPAPVGSPAPAVPEDPEPPEPAFAAEPDFLLSVA